LSQTEIVIAPGSKNLDFLVDYYREYFAPLASINIGKHDSEKEFRLVLDDDSLSRGDGHPRELTHVRRVRRGHRLFESD
jgi:hypothetical protein